MIGKRKGTDGVQLLVQAHILGLVDGRVAVVDRGEAVGGGEIG